MVDHPARIPRKRRLVSAVVVLLVVVLTGAGIAAARSGLAGRARSYLPWSSAPARCPVTEVAVTAAPDAAPTVDRIVGSLEGHALPDGSCLSVEVRAESPARTVDGNGPVSAPPPQVWVPDSSLWLGQSQGWTLRPAGSLGTSPVVLAGRTSTLTRLGWRHRTPSWVEALRPERHLVAPRMTDDSASLLAVLALARSIGPDPRRAERAVAGLVLAGLRTPADDLAAAAVLARSAGSNAPVLVTSRQAVVQLNLDPTTEDLTGVQPSGAPAVLDYPVVRVGRPTDDPVVGAGADLVAAALTSPDGASTARAAGFGPPAPVVAPATTEGKAAAAQVASFIARVRLLAQTSRMLILLDTSLSMSREVKPGVSRIRLAVQAALGTGQLLPDTSAIGLWSFAGRQAKDQPYRELARVMELGAVDAGDSHRHVVDAALADAPKRLSPGGTALYDSTLSAMRTVRTSYDPKATNAVVVFTDGANEYSGGIDLKEFQRKVAADAKAHPRAPILLVCIGIGPAADMEALRAMVAPVGGRAYRAESTEAVRTLLLESMAHRTPHPGS
jgi:Ca-activated chloride channel family protein